MDANRTHRWSEWDCQPIPFFLCAYFYSIGGDVIVECNIVDLKTKNHGDAGYLSLFCYFSLVMVCGAILSCLDTLRKRGHH